MTKNVVYILGAGFSAPLGIPTMRTFIDKARQLRRGNPQFAYFEEVIKLVQDTVSAGVFFQHDSRNIEEALSLLEMKDAVEGRNAKEKLVQFIIDVIQASTPPTPSIPTTPMPSNFEIAVFTMDQVWQGYCAFVASMGNLEFHRVIADQSRGLNVRRMEHTVKYSVLSLNYDLALENTCAFLGSSYHWESDSPMHFNRDTAKESDEWPRLVKIHGSVDTGEIIPPTFNKGLYGSDLPQSWRLAYDILTRASEIRVIGYSLPQTDSYIKYLLMASVDRLKDLDRVDWIIRDTRDEVHQRVQAFMKFDNTRFARSDVSRYLQSIFAYAVNRRTHEKRDRISFRFLEEAHEEFMKSSST